MVKSHLKRLSAPKSWQIKRKGIKFITRPNPGAHSMKNSVSLSLLLKDLLKYAKTTKEVKDILYNKNVLVDGKRRKDHKLPIGIMDVLEVTEMKEHFRILFDQKGKITPVSIKKDEAAIKPCKILNKTKIKGNKTQVNLSDNKNIILKKDDYP